VGHPDHPKRRRWAGLRSSAGIAALVLAVASSQGCGSGEGPPSDPGDIESPGSLLITNGDIDEAGRYSPYGVVLRWWQALQRGDVQGVKESYVGQISSKEARRQIDVLSPRTSQPIYPEVATRENRASMEVLVRSANVLADTSDVVSVRDFQTHFYLVGTWAGWRLRLDSYRNYVNGRQKSHLAVR
jgi:hypothetical protein